MGKNDNDFGIGDLLLGAAAVAGLFGLGVRRIKEAAKADAKRRAIPIQWTEGLSPELFQKFCMESAKGIRRLKIISIDGLYIEGEVITNSGITTWEFSADFYDYGKLTGRYFINYRGNYDSTIPDVFLKKVADRIKEIIYNYDVFPPMSNKVMMGMKLNEVKELFVERGFLDVSTRGIEKPILKLFKKTGRVCKVEINDESKFDISNSFKSGSKVKIFYYEN